ncbi:MAG: DUF1266 domain-containing protein [Arachidicoccus sp.]|nr:DUF1266 domain-containing protein [Arachidicoccus sp.]
MTNKHFCAIAFFIFSIINFIGCKNKTSSTSNSNAQQSVFINDDTLKGFLLAGVYFIKGYGGTDLFNNKIMAEVGKDTTQKNFLDLLDTAYHKYLIFPFHRSAAEKVDARNTLSEWFQINDQNDFYLFLANLKDSGFQAHYILCKKAIDANGGANAVISQIDLDKYNMPKGSEVLLKFVKDNYNKFSSAGIKAWNIGLYVYTVCLGYGAEYIDAANGKNIVAQMFSETTKYYSDWKTYYNDFMLGRQFSGTDPSSNADFQKIIDSLQTNIYSPYKYLPLRN